MRCCFAALAAGCLLFAAPASAETVLKVGYTLPAESAMGEASRVFAAELNKALPGKYRVDDQPASKLGGDVEVLKAVKLGTVEMTVVGGGGGISLAVPEIAVTDLPFLFRDSQHAATVLDGPIGSEILESCKKYGLVCLAWGEQGMRQLTNSRRPVTTLADVKGLKVRVPQSKVYVSTFEALGADVQPMPWPDVYPALQSGRIDAQENPAPTIIAGKVHEVQKYLTLSNHIFSSIVLVVSADVWAEVPEADKPAFLAAAKTAGAATRTYVRKRDQESIDLLRTKGIEVATIADREPFIKAVEPVYAGLDPAVAALAKRIRDAK
jgi:tripartite ATP-independent transporter DctP family solute receptor